MISFRFFESNLSLISNSLVRFDYSILVGLFNLIGLDNHGLLGPLMPRSHCTLFLISIQRYSFVLSYLI